MNSVQMQSQVGESLTTGVELMSIYAGLRAKVKKPIFIIEVQSRRTAPMDNDHQISHYDRSYGSLHSGQFLHSKPSTIKNMDLLGRAETFIVETVRTDEGDVIFIECIDPEGHTRLRLPSAVASAIARQSVSLGLRSKKLKAKAAMAARMADGYVPTFAK